MATTPAPNSIPYPVGTDRVMDGDNAMQAIAERVDTRLGKWSSWAPTTTAYTASAGYTATYQRSADLVQVAYSAALASVVPGQLAFSLPITPTSPGGFMVYGRVSIIRQGSRTYYGDVIISAPNWAQFVDPVTGNIWSNTTPAAFQPGDVLYAWFSYRPVTAN